MVDNIIASWCAVPQFKDFPRGDARRYLLALHTASRLKERATIHYIAAEIGCTRSEAQRALEAAALQFGVVFEKDGSTYTIASWGVLKKSAIPEILGCDDEPGAPSLSMDSDSSRTSAA